MVELDKDTADITCLNFRVVLENRIGVGASVHVGVICVGAAVEGGLGVGLGTGVVAGAGGRVCMTPVI